jgi:hypothetical protein
LKRLISRPVDFAQDRRRKRSKEAGGKEAGIWFKPFFASLFPFAVSPLARIFDRIYRIRRINKKIPSIQPAAMRIAASYPV